MPQNTLKVLWVTTLITGKRLSLKLLKRANLVLQKGTKENKLSLGYWLDILEANMICTFLTEFETLKNKKRKLPYEKATNVLYNACKKWVISTRSLQI